jgi:tetratricopeptide (TPR) repeat protein
LSRVGDPGAMGELACCFSPSQNNCDKAPWATPSPGAARCPPPQRGEGVFSQICNSYFLTTSLACVILLVAGRPVRGAPRPSQAAQEPAKLTGVVSPAQSHERAGIQLARQGKLSEAAAQFLQALWINPRLAEADYNLGLVRLSWGDRSAAIQSFRQALRIDPSYIAAQLSLASLLTRLAHDHPARLTEAMAECQKAIRLDPRQPEAHFDLGVLEAENLEFRKAAVEYEEALRLQPHFPDGKLDLAIARYHLAQFGRAYDLLKEAVLQDPQSATAHRYLGMLLNRREQWIQAAQELRVAIRLDPQNPQAHYALAVALRHSRNPNQAALEMETEERLQTQLNENQQARFHAQRAESLIRTGNMEGAIQEYQRSLQLTEDPGIACSLASALLWQGHDDRALQVVERAIAANPKYTWSYYYLGLTLARMREFAPARQALENALKLKPDFPEAELYIGLTYAGQGQLQEAERYMRSAAEARPDSAPARYYWGLVLQKLGKQTRGKVEIDAAYRLDPQFKPQ